MKITSEHIGNLDSILSIYIICSDVCKIIAKYACSPVSQEDICAFFIRTISTVLDPNASQIVLNYCNPELIECIHAHSRFTADFSNWDITDVPERLTLDFSNWDLTDVPERFAD